MFRVFRRGSRAGFSEEEELDESNPFSPASSTDSPVSTRPSFTRSVDNVNLAELFTRQGSAPAGITTSPAHSQEPLFDEHMETNQALTKLDDFLDLVANSNADRIEHQRSSMPPNVHQKQLKPENVPKYYLPTSQVAKLVQEHQPSDGWGNMPRHSMPNLLVGRVEEVDEYSDSETSSTPGGSRGDLSHFQDYQDADQYQDTGRYYQDSSQDAHQRASSYDTTYGVQRVGTLMEEDFKSRSATEMGESDQLVEKYWEVATPPRRMNSPLTLASSPISISPPAKNTPIYGNFLSPDDAKHYFPSCISEKSSQTASQQSYTSDSPDRIGKQR